MGTFLPDLASRYVYYKRDGTVRCAELRVRPAIIIGASDSMRDFVTPDYRRYPLFESVKDALDAIVPAYSASTVERRRQRGWLFRGQAKAMWALTPSLYRAPYDANVLKQRRNWTREFIGALRCNAPRLGLDVISDRQWMAIAQHYGFPTEFLDFTYNAEVAAYFATVSAANGEIGVIYCLNYARAEELSIDRLPPLISEDLKCAPRVVSQEGVFLKCGPESAPLLMEMCMVRFYFRQSNVLTYRGGLQPKLWMLPDPSDCDSLATYESIVATARRQHPEMFHHTLHISEARLYHPHDALSKFAENWRRTVHTTEGEASQGEFAHVQPTSFHVDRTWQILVSDLEQGHVGSVDALLPRVVKSAELQEILLRVPRDVRERLCDVWDALPARLLTEFVQPAFEMGMAVRWIGNLCEHLVDAWSLELIMEAEMALEEPLIPWSIEPFAARLWGLAENDVAAFDFESKAPRVFFRSAVPLSSVATVLRRAMPVLVSKVEIDEAVKSDLLAFTDEQLMSPGYIQLSAMLADRFLSFLDTEQRWELWTSWVVPVGVVFARGDNHPFLDPGRVFRCGFP